MKFSLTVTLIFASCTLLACSTARTPEHRDQIPDHEVRIAFGSCTAEPNSAIWKSIKDKSPDLMLFLGDNVYFEDVDFKNKVQLESHYQNLFGQPSFMELINSVPTYSIWDDHDYGPNNSDSEFPEAATTRALFLKYWGEMNNPSGLEGSLARAISISGVRILLTDNRTFRINPGKAQSTMFGVMQLKWLESELAAPRERVVVIASGGQLLVGAHGYEGLFQYPAEKERLVKAIQNSPATVAILSGDRHFSEILDVPLGSRRVLEFTSSPLSARVAPAKIDKGQLNRRAAYFGSQNFGILSIKSLNATLSLTAHLYDQNGQTLLGVYQPLN